MSIVPSIVPFLLMTSVTRRLAYSFNFWPFRAMKFAQQHKKFTNIGSQVCQILNKLLKNKPRLKIFS